MLTHRKDLEVKVWYRVPIVCKYAAFIFVGLLALICLWVGITNARERGALLLAILIPVVGLVLINLLERALIYIFAGPQSAPGNDKE